MVLGFDHFATPSGYPGQVVGIDPSEPGRAVWTTASLPLEPPGGMRRDATPTLDVAITADVFPAIPGKEIVAAHSLYPYSASAVRVLDLSGQVRFEVWHDGAVQRIAWLEGAGLLVLTSLNSEAVWSERGHDLRDGRYPVVVMALEPREGHISRGRWVAHGGERHEPLLRWYRWVGPADRLAPLGDPYAELEPPGSGWDRRRMVELKVSVAARKGDGGGGWGVRPTFTLLLDEQGRVVGRSEDDLYKTLRSAGELPASDAFSLLEYEALPPVRP